MQKELRKAAVSCQMRARFVARTGHLQGLTARNNSTRVTPWPEKPEHAKGTKEPRLQAMDCLNSSTTEYFLDPVPGRNRTNILPSLPACLLPTPRSLALAVGEAAQGKEARLQERNPDPH
jgi:hypothetical protein